MKWITIIWHQFVKILLKYIIHNINYMSQSSEQLKKINGYTVTMSASIDYETTLDLHLYLDDKRIAKFIDDESGEWGTFRRNLFLNDIVNRIWEDSSTKFESSAVKKYVENHVINGEWSGYEPDAEPRKIKRGKFPSETLVTITGVLNNYTVNMYTVLNKDEHNILKAYMADTN